MSIPLRILIVDDSDDDAELLVADLRDAGYDPDAERVDTAAAMGLALDEQAWDVVIIDYSMPHFSAHGALALVRERQLDLPAFVVSGTIEESVAVALMRAGARDYIMKGHLARLIPALDRELQGSIERRGRRQIELERQRMQAALSQYIHPKLARMVGEDPSSLHFGGEKRNLTVLFSDLRDFSSMAENLDPDLLVSFLAEYLGAMTDVIFDHGGMLDKYMGDGIMALWGAPFVAEDHAARACRAALDMADRLKELNAAWSGPPRRPLEMGVGINTGTVVVGNLGTPRRFTYTAVGDHVNLGARLEQLNKRWGTDILVSEYTRSGLGDEFAFRELDIVKVKGRRQSVRVFELFNARDLSEPTRQFLDLFDEALQAYRSKAWEQALRLFSGCLALRADVPARLYVERCRFLIDHLPAPDWDGITELDPGAPVL